MEALLSLIAFAVGLFFLVAPVLGVIAFAQMRELRRQTDDLRHRLDVMAATLRSAGPADARPTPEALLPEAPEAPAEEAPAAEAAEAAAAAEEAAGKVAEEPPAEAPPDLAAAAAAPTTPEPPSRGGGVEEALTSRWMVWLGAVTVGLSAVFFFSYAVEQGWLGPLPRVLLGLAAGAALIAAGEWAYRRPLPGLERIAGPDYVPPALTASGVFALYASVYAAHAVFDLIGAPVAFAALGAVSFAALVLAVRQGWFVALLGLAGGYAMPAVLSPSEPAPVPVFTYLFVLTTACLGVMVFRKWPFLAIATLIGCTGWPLLWFADVWTIGDELVLGLYSTAIAAVFALLSVGFPVKRPETPATAWLAGMVGDTSGMGFVAQGGLLVLLAVLSDYNAAAFVFLALYAGIGAAFGLRRAAFESLAVAGALIVALAFLLWPEPPPITIPAELAQNGIRNYGDTFGPIEMPEPFVVFGRAALFFAAFFGIGGFAALRRAPTPPVWAALSAAMPVYLFVIAYWRIGGFDLNIQWAGLAAGLSFAMLAAASRVDRMVSQEERNLPLGFYAAATTGALALAFTCVLREAWLTVALSLELPALGWIWARLRVEAIRTIAYALAGSVIVRLVLNHHLIDYEGSVAGVFSWVLYGYGVPAIAFLAAARLFGDAKREPLAALCEAGAVAFGFLMVAFQLRDWTAGAIYGPEYGLFDQAVQTIWWMVAAGLLLQRQVTERSQVALYGGRVLLALAALQVVVGQLLDQNPLFHQTATGDWPLLNLLGLAYLAPAVLAAILAAGERFELDPWVRQGLRAAAGVLVFVYLTLETRRAFQGSIIALWPGRAAGNDEIYAYSAVWILYALALLAFGILRNSGVLRYASLTVLIVTVAKVFLYDMSDLEGLYRVASFLGLGLTLIGIGHVYRRFVFRPGAA